MEIPVIYIFTHDSIGVGEDGPTHQPVEQLASLRAIPGLIVLRPGDANEVVEAWSVIMQLQHEPVGARPDAPGAADPRPHASTRSAAGVAQGAYVLADAPGGKPEVLLLATGSEVSLCVEAYEQLVAEGIKARVVSMPSWELFERQAAGVPRPRAAAGGHGARLGRAGVDVRLGALRRASTARASACRPSAPRRRSRSCRRSSASPSTTSSPRPRRRSPRAWPRLGSA